MLGKIPQIAPRVKLCIISEFPLFSKYTHTKTKAPVNGMTAIRPAIDGIFFAIPVAMKIIIKLIDALIRICMIISPCVQQVTGVYKT